AGEAAVAEFLPSFDALMKEAQSATPETVSGLLAKIAGARFTNVEDRRLLSALDAATALGFQALRADLKAIRNSAAPKHRAIALTGGWQGMLIIDKEKGEAKPIMSNAFNVALRHPAFAGVLALKDFTDLIELLLPPPW